MNEEQGIQQQHAAGSGDRDFGLRLGIIGVLMLVFFTAIVMQLLRIQVLDVGKYREKASRQYVRKIDEHGRRGSILDRHGRPLAESVETISFAADPSRIKDRSQVARLFSQNFGKSSYYYLKKLKRKRRFVWMERNVPVTKAAGLMTAGLKGIDFRREQQRHYLNVAAQLIGLTDRDNLGVSGLEKSFEKRLRGGEGSRVFYRSAIGELYPAPDVEQVPPLGGNSVELTIDADIQAIVEDEIMRAVNEQQATAAMGIVMDVRSGEILAMANYPTFDMNSRKGVTFARMRNRAVTDMFEPGSTFKLVMAAGATEVLHWKASHVVDGHEGLLMIHGKPVRDHEPLGLIPFRKAITESSNVVAASTALQLGPENFYHYATALGFGKKTGVGLIGESSGLLKPVSDWGKLTLPWMGYGYQVMATPLQVLQAYATLANDGARMRPYIVRRIIDPDGRVVMENEPKKVVQALEPESARYITREYFRPVVEEGTGQSAAIEGVAVAGKTGTAQKFYNGSYHGWSHYLSSFVGYFPAENPQYAAIIVVDEPKTAYYASAVAAPVFSRVCGRALACSPEMQRRLELKSPERSRLDGIATVAVPVLQGLSGNEASKLLEWHGLSMGRTGDDDGYVTSQSVAPGTKVRKESRVTVHLERKKKEK
ncbi:Peptidoglycan glycosyltransferase [Chlorobaculum parvum NCIB 8327]|uniref:Peptidoglycan glycosyltransferase n=1 Tax=Chlorobaculum parvum (strain DSM 263 / NCIMB 8327) TaxID=517417 RepID=B3QLX0_CHLP8|nr:penicillin-binding protein [Chlorobaculum parvum]ACF12456.1 Peptidoglycan glycosyltransferase [Chlorobaculum parvum NCIB 8327]